MSYVINNYSLIFIFICSSLFCPTSFAADFWQPTALYGGYAQPIAFAPNGDIYIGTSSGGIFYSSDDGITWTSANHKTFFFQQLAFDNEGGLWGASWAIPGLVYSDDNGKTWAGKLDTAFNYESSLLILPDNTVLITRPEIGVLRSGDRGKTWTTYNSFSLWDTYVSSLVYDASDSSVYVGVIGTGLFRSQDKGQTWIQYLSEELEYSATGVLPDHIVMTSDQSIYLARKGEATTKEIYRGNGSILALATLSDSTIIAGDSNGQVIVSHDLGRTWKIHNLMSFVRGIKVAPTGTILVTDREGVWRSTDRGVSWEPANTGILGQPIQTVFAIDNTTLFASGVMGKNFRSTDRGQTWGEIPFDTVYNPIYCMTQTSDGTLYAGTGSVMQNLWGRGIYVSHDVGISWQQLNTELQDSTIRAIGTTRNGIVYAGTERNGVFRQTDDKSGWEQTPLTDVGVWSLLVDSSDNIFAGAVAGAIYRSKDDGATWTSVQLPTSGDIQSMAQAFDGTLYAVSFDGTGYYSEDGGDTWYDTGIEDNTLLAVAVDKNGHVYTAGKKSFVRKQKNGEWEDITGNIAAHPALSTFYSLTLTPDGTPWMATSRGVFMGRPATTFVPFAEAQPIQFTAYPNPIKDMATIEFTLTSPTNNVQLEIFTSMGEPVLAVTRRSMKTGTYAIPWTATNVPSGLYYCRLTCDGRSESVVLTVLK